MTATALGAHPPRGSGNGWWDRYKGWLVGWLIILIVLAAGGAFWFQYHP